MTYFSDNRQTLPLFDESVKLETKLHHVDIHNHWLRQECRKGTAQLQWEKYSVESSAVSHLVATG
jgi:hypothetical protein